MRLPPSRNATKREVQESSNLRKQFSLINGCATSCRWGCTYDVFPERGYLTGRNAALNLSSLPLLLLLASPAEAQVYTGSITGLIQDPSGAVVPNASVVLTDTTKGLKYSATTDSSVRYGAAQSAAEHI